MDHTTRLKRAQELESEIKAHNGEIKAKRDVAHHKSQIKIAQAQIKTLLPKGCKTCRAAAQKINNTLGDAGYFKMSGRHHVLTVQERDSALEDTMNKMFVK